MKLRPLSNGIFFKFTEAASASTFVNKTTTGIVIASGRGDQSNIARWGQVTDVGPKVENVAVGDYALIEAGKWTVGFDIDGERTWKTDETSVLFTSDEPGSAY